MKNISSWLFFLLFIIGSTSCSNDAVVSDSTTLSKSRVSLASSNVINNIEVTIGNQVWMKKNLNVSNYRNGDVIPQVTDPSQWANLTTGAWCYNNNLSANGLRYGKLYNWFAVNDARGLAPEGYHIPSSAEWQVIKQSLGGISISGGKMKSMNLWMYPNTNATNESGFTAFPGGMRHQDGSFVDSGYSGIWWHNTIDVQDTPNIEQIAYNSGVGLEYSYNKKGALSVRCVKD